MTEFIARAAGYTCEADLGVELVTVAENEDGSGRRLEIQKSLTVSEQDRLLNQDQYALVNERGVVHYGGITDWHVDAAAVRLKLAPDAGAALGAAKGYVIHLQGPASGQVDQLRLGLARILSQT